MKSKINKHKKLTKKKKIIVNNISYDIKNKNSKTNK